MIKLEGCKLISDFGYFYLPSGNYVVFSNKKEELILFDTKKELFWKLKKYKDNPILVWQKMGKEPGGDSFQSMNFERFIEVK